MSVRKAEKDDLGRIEKIYSIAREYMKKEGNPTQWGDTYPLGELIKEDFEQGRLYVLYDGVDIYGVFSFFEAGDRIYDRIDGEWLNDLPHAAIHRVASSGERRGVLGECVQFALGFSKNLKMDTHKDNIPMQHALQKQGFVCCGKITIETGEEFTAFQLSK